MSKEGIFDEYYRCGERWIRMPVSQEPDDSSIITGDSVIDKVLYKWPHGLLWQWRVTEEEVERWTMSLSNGEIPDGHVEMGQFVNKVAKQMGRKYEIAKKRIEKGGSI